MATVVYAGFEWDEAKAELNERKHGVTFEEAVTALWIRAPSKRPTTTIQTAS